MPAEPPARSRETEPDPEPADIEAAPPKASAQAPPADVHFFAEDESEKPRKVKKRLTSPGMMVGGIILASSGPIFLAVGVLTTHCPHQSTDSCDAGPRLLAFGLGAAALIGVGVPLIVMGAKRVPVRQVAIAPWVSPRDAGLAMQLQF